MSVTYTSHVGKIKGDTQQKTSIFLRFAAEQVVDDSLPRTPKKMGNLRQDILRQILGLKGKIVWGKNYAAFQETKQFKNYTTPGTGPRFAEDAINGIGDKTADIARKAGLIER